VQHHVQSCLAMSIQKQVSARIGAGKRLSAEEVAFLKIVSSDLRAQLWHSILAPRLTAHPFFQVCDCLNSSCIWDLCTVVHLRSVGPGVVIFESGEVAKDFT